MTLYSLFPDEVRLPSVLPATPEEKKVFSKLFFNYICLPYDHHVHVTRFPGRVHETPTVDLSNHRKDMKNAWDGLSLLI